MEFTETKTAELLRRPPRFETEKSSTGYGSNRQAIADATYFDKRDINRNFRYDYAAYFGNREKRNLDRFFYRPAILRPAMELSLELMVKGSHQIEMSDEGLMSDDIKECLQVVLEALKHCDLPADEVAAWCTHMLAADSVGFVCDEELKTFASNPRHCGRDPQRFYTLAGRTPWAHTCSVSGTPLHERAADRAAPVNRHPSLSNSDPGFTINRQQRSAGEARLYPFDSPPFWLESLSIWGRKRDITDFAS